MFNLNINNIDETKADLGIRHEYVPKTPFNLAIPNEEERIVFDIEYLRSGEQMKYVRADADGNMEIDSRKAFRDKVKGIRNLRINGKPVTTAEELLKYPAVPELDALVISAANHVFTGDRLTEDERKNS